MNISQKFQLICIVALCIVFLNTSVIYAQNDDSRNEISPGENMKIINFEIDYAPYMENSSTIPLVAYGEEENKSTQDKVENSQKIAAYGESGNSTSNYKANGALWVRYWSMESVNFQELKASGITDVFLDSEALSNPNYKNSLQSFLFRAQTAEVRVNAWVVCFYNQGQWVDPAGKYTYNVTTTYQEAVQVPYQEQVKVEVKVPYTVKVAERYKSWYKSKGVWRYVWKTRYVTRTLYKITYQYQNVTRYRTEYVTKTKNETLVGYNSTFIQNYNDNLLNTIETYTRMEGIGGIHLDYLRYSGNAYNSTNGTQAITNFVSRVRTMVKSINPDILLSAALMPECAVNSYYYGQDYLELSNYLDVLIPMIYKGNYGKNSTWIETVTQYIVNNSKKPVWAGIMTYYSDNNVTPLPYSELVNDVQMSLDNGAQGYVLFRYGLIDQQFFENSANLNYKPVPIGDPSIINVETIPEAAIKVKAYLETYQRLPEWININQNQVYSGQLMYLLVSELLQLDKVNQSPIDLVNVKNSPDFTGDVISGNILKLEYLELATRVSNYIKNYGVAPNYATSSRGKINSQALIGFFARIIAFHTENGQLPSYVELNTLQILLPPRWTGSVTLYLQSTTKCPANDPVIKNLANSLTAGLNSTWDKAEVIFNWVRDNIDYNYYYNTQKGAKGTLDSYSGNCVDQSHLLVALIRALGIPARYAHGDCTFNSGNVYGHVWGEVLINGKWLKADTISYSNSLGVVNNWNIYNATMKGIYSEVPF